MAGSYAACRAEGRFFKTLTGTRPLMAAPPRCCTLPISGDKAAALLRCRTRMSDPHDPISPKTQNPPASSSGGGCELQNISPA